MDGYISIPGKSLKVHLQLLKTDIITVNTQSVVVFRKPDGTAEGDSLRVLKAAGDDVEVEYNAAKAQGGREVAKGVVLTGAGNLIHLRHIFHLQFDVDNLVKVKDAFMTTLRLADKKELQSVSFPFLGKAGPVNTTVMELFSEFTEQHRPICLHFIQIVGAYYDGITQDNQLRQIAEFEKYRSLLVDYQFWASILKYGAESTS